jgi:hypothetical protein
MATGMTLSHLPRAYPRCGDVQIDLLSIAHETSTVRRSQKGHVRTRGVTITTTSIFG